MVNKQLEQQAHYFRAGLMACIDISMLSLFSPQELQTLISGEDGFDTDDLRAHCNIHGFQQDSPTVKALFEVLHEMSPSQRSLFLMFVLSVPRTPIFGCADISPPLTISKMDLGQGNERERLPTASTCSHMLHLPDYQDKELLRQKVL